MTSCIDLEKKKALMSAIASRSSWLEWVPLDMMWWQALVMEEVRMRAGKESMLTLSTCPLGM